MNITSFLKSVFYRSNDKAREYHRRAQQAERDKIHCEKRLLSLTKMKDSHIDQLQIKLSQSNKRWGALYNYLRFTMNMGEADIWLIIQQYEIKEKK